MNESNNGAEDFFEIEESPEVAELKPKFLRFLQKRIEAEETITDEKELRAAQLQIHKEMMREAFLSNSFATEEDFERLWPRLRDDELCEHAQDIYMQVMEALTDELGDEDFLSDDLS